MKSAVAVTYELDDAAEAARQLAGTIKEKLTLAKNSVGIMYCDAETDGSAVTGELKKLLGIEIAGMTTLAPIDQEGYRDSAIVLTVMTADDCTFSAAASVPLTRDNYEQGIIDSYRATLPGCAGYGDKPVLLFAFCPFPMPFSADQYPEMLSKETGGIPVIGGVASDDYDYNKARVFLSGREFKDSFVVLSVSGKLKPLFSLRHVTSRFAERIRRVTNARDNIVYSVGDETFVQYLQGFGLKTDVSDVQMAFNPYPMMLTQGNDDEVPLMRHIVGLNFEEGSGVCVGDVPVGAQANICMLKKEDLYDSCRESMNALLEDAAKQEGYEYSTLLCISCCGRSLLLGADSVREGQILTELLPENMTLFGTYCYGEICPTRYTDGKAINRLHNCSFALCMM